MKKELLLVLMLGVAISGNAQKAVKIWETPAVLDVPESVLFDDSVIYVSNVGGNPTIKDTNGYISRISINGEILTQKWIVGLHAPKGMAVYRNLLYVSDIDRVALIDRKAGKIVQFIEMPGTKFLNDVTNSNQGFVAVSDMLDNAIYLIKDSKAELLLKNEDLKRVNGLYWENEVLFAGTSDVIFRVDVANKTFQKYAIGTGGIDGLERYSEDTFIISDWVGKIQVVSTNEAPIEILNVATENYNAADIDFDVKSRILYIPTFKGSSVAAYRIDE